MAAETEDWVTDKLKSLSDKVGKLETKAEGQNVQLTTLVDGLKGVRSTIRNTASALILVMLSVLGIWMTAHYHHVDLPAHHQQGERQAADKERMDGLEKRLDVHDQRLNDGRR